ncbi:MULTISPECIES: Type 1 glutamine amidotransferase-like domain-containing protein [unclassified Rathayibacter]|uniref:Type 1 glutamine amidotransferase-like domain-containing protein n=1 Tax=unclassified Rathayibacter TaxID=2609250 RepID=UPI00188AD426|nr:MULTISPECIES: Type 1 glutamine amidotransferase-like domain-containing protein [unclassified Rathayibacter]MBF4463409.1 Type 1 glutamine amidotransferase-like domain-containing protein [Rathayibacter sp. VKM Ac-2879]MBF4504868.1 Type 1 glutamine amidotransferase-like domain-containing protein [Rathayibacter sp. VKM Ac-2878]
MSVHLIGGGGGVEHDQQLYSAFLAEARDHAVDVGRIEGPRVAIVVVHDGLGPEAYAGYAALLASVAPLDPFPVMKPEGGRIDPAVFDDVDGVFVGGGLTPAYRDALESCFARLRELVSSGVPYAGFSAGAAVAADRAIVGGHRIGGVAVAPEAAAEELDEVTVLEGIGLVDVSVDVHAAQWGTLGRLVAAVEAGLVDGGVALDESTLLTVGTGALQVGGAGSVWRVVGGASGVQVSTLAAS